jgi:hypothetical protein
MVAYGHPPPDTSSSELSLSASFPGVEEILFGAPSLRLSPGSACPFEFMSCPLVIFNLHLSSMLIGASPTLKPYAQLMSALPGMGQSGHADIDEIDHFGTDARRQR